MIPQSTDQILRKSICDFEYVPYYNGIPLASGLCMQSVFTFNYYENCAGTAIFNCDAGGIIDLRTVVNAGGSSINGELSRATFNIERVGNQTGW